MNIELIKNLRVDTGRGLADCKKALEQTNDDFDKAKEYLKQNRSVGKEKSTNCGIIVSYIHMSRIGAMIELNCETDFVAKMPDFKELAGKLCQHIVGMNSKTIEELLAQPYCKDLKIKPQDMINEFSATCKETIKIGNFARFEINSKFKVV